MPYNEEMVAAFRQKAELVNAVVQEKANLAEALQYVVEVCEKKAPCEMLAPEPSAEQGPLGPNKMPTRVKRIVAAPDLDDAQFESLKKACDEKGFVCIREGLRNHLAGIDVGFSQAMLGIAASGTCMCATDKEEIRLAGMISEIHVLALRKSQMYPDLPSIAQFLRDRMEQNVASYTSFITGPSRTADIERVAAVGVHGPLELHIILLED